MPLPRPPSLRFVAALLGGAALAMAAGRPGASAAPASVAVPAAASAPAVAAANPLPVAAAPASPVPLHPAPGGEPGTAPAAVPLPPSFAGLAARLLPAVVNIAAVAAAPGTAPPELPPELPPGAPFRKYFDRFMDRRHPQAIPQPQRVESLGSGFIVDPSGLIVTNQHVIAGASRITVTLADGTTLPARLVGEDKVGDLALVKVAAPAALPAVHWGDSDAVRIGDWVLAVGNPFGLGGSVTAGIISARGRDIHEGPYDDFLQTDAAINRGNSGGPLFDMQGRVIGVATAIFSPSGGSIGIGFAIPSDMARREIAQLREYGRPRRGWLGVRVQRVTPGIAAGLGLGAARGVLVAGVAPDGPAAEAQLRPGDVILSFDGREARARIMPRLVAEAEIGTAVPLLVWRDGRQVTLHARIAVQPDVPAHGAAPR